MSGLTKRFRIHQLLQTRLAVLTATAGAISTLVTTGTSPLLAVAVATAGTLGGAVAGYWLTRPYPSPQIRVTVLILVIVLVVNVTRVGKPEWIPLVLLAMLFIAELARRVAGLLVQVSSTPA